MQIIRQNPWKSAIRPHPVKLFAVPSSAKALTREKSRVRRPKNLRFSGNFFEFLNFYRKNPPKLYESWTFLQQIDLSTEILEQDFTYFDKNSQKLHELKPNGKEINVSQENKLEFIELSLQKFIEKDLNFRQILVEEFHNVIPLKFLQVFSLKELEMLLGGLKRISLEEWRANTEYKGIFHQKHRVILWFWDIMNSYNQEQLSKMLQFCTGSSRIPLEGFRYWDKKFNFIQFL